jgi:hypothetical protein
LFLASVAPLKKAKFVESRLLKGLENYVLLEPNRDSK